jgi:predicted hydrocarbon binding protein
MTAEKREYSGAALNSFILALGHSDLVVKKILADKGVDRIDPEIWYDFDFAISFFYKIEAEMGRAALSEVGKKMIETATYPPEIDSIQALLSGIGYWYELNARGPNVGTIVCTFEDEHTATLDWSCVGPCSIRQGIIEGACARYGVKPLIEHGEGCMDQGAKTCIFQVSW